jgi:hypothetical protein
MGARRQGLVTSEPPGELWLLLEELTLVAPAAGPSPFEHRLARAGRDVHTVAILLGQASGLLRQMVRVAGWLVVLAAADAGETRPTRPEPHMAGRQSAAFARSELCIWIARPATPTHDAQVSSGRYLQDHGSCRPLPLNSGRG